jgi:hypothetical protein
MFTNMRNFNLKFISVVIFAAAFIVGGFFINTVNAFAITDTTAPVTAPTLSLSGVPTTVTTEIAILETSGVIDSNFDTKKGTLIQATLIKGSTDYSNVRVVVTGLTSGVQLIAQDTTGIWYNIAETGWGPKAGFNLATVTTPVYLVASIAGTYNATINLVDVSNSNTELASTPVSITANDPDKIAPTAKITHDEIAKTITYTFSEPVQLLNSDGCNYCFS